MEPKTDQPDENEPEFRNTGDKDGIEPPEWFERDRDSTGRNEEAAPRDGEQ